MHYTNAVFYYAKHGFQILGIDQLLIYNTAFNLTRVYTSLTATAIVYLIFGLMIVILGTWRGWQALDQDLNGRVYDNQAGLTMFMIFILQIVWFLIMLWLVLLMMGDAVFVAWIYVVKGGLYSSIRAQFWAQNQWTPTPYQNPYTCPVSWRSSVYSRANLPNHVPCCQPDKALTRLNLSHTHSFCYRPPAITPTASPFLACLIAMADFRGVVAFVTGRPLRMPMLPLSVRTATLLRHLWAFSSCRSTDPFYRTTSHPCGAGLGVKWTCFREYQITKNRRLKKN